MFSSLRRLPRLLFVLLCSILFFGNLAPVLAQPAAAAPVLSLPPPATRFTSKEFYVGRVLDERPKATALARLLLPPAQPGQPGPVQATELRGGSAAAIRQHFRQTLPQTTGRRALTLRVRECQITEAAVPGQPAAEGHVTVRIGLEWEREGETIALTEYRGAARYRRPLGQVAGAEAALGQTLTEAARYFHIWVEAQAPGSLPLATGLRLRFTDYQQQTEPDTLFYDPARPLVWADFTGPVRTGPHAAAVFPSFAYAGQPRVVQGVLQLDMRMKVFVVRSSSWVSAAARGAYDLKHEQRHFDIVKLVAERYKRRLTPERLTLRRYNSILQYEYLVAFQEMNRLQEQYDAETHGGQDAAAQERWNRRIEQELREYSGQP